MVAERLGYLAALMVRAHTGRPGRAHPHLANGIAPRAVTRTGAPLARCTSPAPVLHPTSALLARCAIRIQARLCTVQCSFSAFARWRGGGSHRLLHWNRVNHANPSARQADDSTAFRMMNMCCSGIISPTWWKGLGLFYASLATRSFGMGPGTF